MAARTLTQPSPPQASRSSRVRQARLCFEQPLDENIRLALRLEALFQRLSTLIYREEEFSHHNATLNLQESLTLIERFDIKSKLILPLLKHMKQAFTHMQRLAHVDQSSIVEILSKINDFYQYWLSDVGKIQLPFPLQHFMQMLPTQHSACEIYLSQQSPRYHYWLQQPAHRRQQDLQQFFQVLSPLHETLSTLLQLIRQSATPQSVETEGGYCQINLAQSPKIPYLVQVQIDPQLGCVPEISANKHRLCIRLRNANANQASSAYAKDITLAIGIGGF